MSEKDDNDKGKVDYLAKYRASDEAHVVDARFLTFVCARPRDSKIRNGRVHTHCSMPYAALTRVEYFDGRWVADWMDREDYVPKPGEQPEMMTLVYLGGVFVDVMGFRLQPLYRRILRHEVDWIEERFIEGTAERAAIQRQLDGVPIVTSIDVYVEEAG